MTSIIVVDANIMVSALMGRSLPLIAALAERAAVVTPAPQLAETRRILMRRELPAIDQRMADIMEIVEALPIFAYVHYEEQARERLHERGQSDWPVLASALALKAEIWSRDADLMGTGAAIWFTRNIQFAGLS